MYLTITYLAIYSLKQSIYEIDKLLWRGMTQEETEQMLRKFFLEDDYK